MRHLTALNLGPTLPGGQPNKGSVFSSTHFFSFLPSSAPLFPHPNLPVNFTKLLRKLWIISSRFSQGMYLSHCLQGDWDCWKPSFKNEKKKIKELKPKQNRSPALWELDAFKGHPANNRASRDGLSNSSMPTPRKWAGSSQPQLHQLKLLGAGSSSGHCAVVQTEGWCYGSLARCASQRKGCNLTMENRWHKTLLSTAAARESRHSCPAPNTWCPEQPWRRGQQFLSPRKQDSSSQCHSLLHPWRGQLRPGYLESQNPGAIELERLEGIFQLYSPHFTDEQTESQTEHVSHPRWRREKENGIDCV